MNQEYPAKNLSVSGSPECSGRNKERFAVIPQFSFSVPQCPAAKKERARSKTPCSLLLRDHSSSIRERSLFTTERSIFFPQSDFPSKYRAMRNTQGSLS